MTTLIARISEASPELKAKFVLVYYLLTVLTGAFILFFHGRLAFEADLLVAIFYLIATAVLYQLSKPLSRDGSPSRGWEAGRRSTTHN